MSEENNKYLKFNETLDDLIIGNKKIIQAKEGYRFSIDAVLLAHFADLNKAKIAIDLGSGSGVIPIILSQRNNSIQIKGIEIQETLANRATRSILLNNLEEQIEIINYDIKNIEQIIPGGSAELVLSNPPFWRKGEGQLSQNHEEAIARHEIEITADILFEKAFYLLKDLGKLAIIHRADRLQELLALYEKYKMPAKRIRLIYPFINKDAKLVLLEGHKNSKNSGVKILPPLIIYNKPGIYNEEILKIYNV